MIELGSEFVRNAVFREIKKLFPDITVYKESTSNPRMPSAYITIIDVHTEKKWAHSFLLTYNCVIRYHEVLDPSTLDNLQSKLDAAGQHLMYGFDVLKAGDTYIRATDVHYEKQEGVLYFYFTIKMMAIKIDESDAQLLKMHNLVLNINADYYTVMEAET